MHAEQASAGLAPGLRAHDQQPPREAHLPELRGGPRVGTPIQGEPPLRRARHPTAPLLPPVVAGPAPDRLGARGPPLLVEPSRAVHVQLTDLLERCADVHLKEGRPLVIAPREMPWNLLHLRNLTTLAEAGARIAPPIPAWYTQPESIDDMLDFLVMRLFDSLGESLTDQQRWQGPRR